MESNERVQLHVDKIKQEKSGQNSTIRIFIVYFIVLMIDVTIKSYLNFVHVFNDANYAKCNHFSVARSTC